MHEVLDLRPRIVAVKFQTARADRGSPLAALSAVAMEHAEDIAAAAHKKAEKHGATETHSRIISQKLTPAEDGRLALWERAAPGGSMHFLSISSKEDLTVLGHDVPLTLPVFKIPLADAVAAAAAFGLDAVDASDVKPHDGIGEVKFHASVPGVRVARIFGRDINVGGAINGEADLQIIEVPDSV